MRAASGKFSGAFASLRKDKTQDTTESSPTGEGFKQGHPERSTNGSGSGGGGDLGKILKSRVAHTTLIPAIGNQNLRELQDLITSEKGILQGHERLAVDIAKGSNSLATWGSSEGSDLSDVLSHASSILMHLSNAMQKYAEHEGQIRALFKSIRTKEEELEELRKRRRRLGVRAESEEKKLSKMGQENKNLPTQTELLESLRQSMRHMDTDILTEEARVGDYKRRTAKEALALKFGGCLEMAEKATIVGELGKLLTEEIPIEETPVGYARPPYTGFEQTERLSAEAARCISEVSFNPTPVLSLPSRQTGPPSSTHGTHPTNLAPDSADDYRRYARAYGDDPETPNVPANPTIARGYTSDELSPAAPGTHYSYNAVTGTYDLEGYGHGGETQAPKGHVMFAAPTSPETAPAVMREMSFGGPLVLPGLESTQLESHSYEYEQAQQHAREAETEVSHPAHALPERQSSMAALDSTPAWQGETQRRLQDPKALASPGHSEDSGGLPYLAEHESPTPAPGSGSKIMDRGRMTSRATDDSPGDGTSAGYNYGYDNNSRSPLLFEYNKDDADEDADFFVRNHATSPVVLPGQEQVLPLPPHEPLRLHSSQSNHSAAAAANREVQRERENFGLSDDGDHRPLPVPVRPSGMEPRKVSASAFNRGRNNTSSPVTPSGATFANAETLPLRTPDRTKRDSLGNTSGGSLPGSARGSLEHVRPGQGNQHGGFTGDDVTRVEGGGALPPPTYGAAHLDPSVSEDERDLR